jgi:hypothetical protein
MMNHEIGLIICRALQKLGATSENDLQKMLIPMFRTEEKNQQWDNTMAVLLRSSLVTESKGLLVLCDSLMGADEIDSSEFAQSFLRGFTQSNIESLSKGEEVDDFFKALLWFSELPSNYVFSKFDESSPDPNSPGQRIKDFGFEDAVKRNDQWNPLQRWLVGLGLVRIMDKQVNSVDISDFVHYFIKSTDINGSIEALMLSLSETLPMFNQEMIVDWYRDETKSNRKFEKLNQLVAWALFTAEEGGLVRFYTKDDAKVLTFSLPNFEGNLRNVTHIEKVV